MTFRCSEIKKLESVVDSMGVWNLSSFFLQEDFFPQVKHTLIGK